MLLVKEQFKITVHLVTNDMNYLRSRVQLFKALEVIQAKTDTNDLKLVLSQHRYPVTQQQTTILCTTKREHVAY